MTETTLDPQVSSNAIPSTAESVSKSEPVAKPTAEYTQSTLSACENQEPPSLPKPSPFQEQVNQIFSSLTVLLCGERTKLTQTLSRLSSTTDKDEILEHLEVIGNNAMQVDLWVRSILKQIANAIKETSDLSPSEKADLIKKYAGKEQKPGLIAHLKEYFSE